MPKSRFTQVILVDKTFYHYVSRTVWRALLCGIDHYFSQYFEHR